ncbi:MAG TPA: hypothetical protein VN520_16705, partial [Streptomyces sp.]|nr:hypothetical protein [Streptomyces sp.]
MRPTENVRGEWDELGEREARVVLPGPGAEDTPKESPAETPAETEAVTEAGGAGWPGPGDGPEPELESAGTAVVDALPVVDAPLVVDAPFVVEDEDIPADLGPAMDAVAGVGRAVPAGGGVADLHLDLGLEADPDPDASTDLGPDAVPGADPEPARALEPPGLDPAPGLLPLPEAVTGTGTGVRQARPAPAGR